MWTVVREFVLEMSVGLAVGVAGAYAPVARDASPRPAERRPVPAAHARGRGCHLRRRVGAARLRLPRGLRRGHPRRRRARAVQGGDGALLHVAREPRRDRDVRRARADDRPVEPLRRRLARRRRARDRRSRSSRARSSSARFSCPTRLRIGERLFVMWGGLKGAVPIFLAAFAILAGVDGRAAAVRHRLRRRGAVGRRSGHEHPARGVARARADAHRRAASRSRSISTSRSPGRDLRPSFPSRCISTSRSGGAIRASPSCACSASDACTWTSMPTRSTSAHGPSGQPAPFVIAVSRSSGVTPASSRTRTQSFRSGIRIRLTMKPGVSLQLTGRLPAPLGPLVRRADRVVARAARAHDLHERQHRRRVEEVHADDALRAAAVASAISETESADVFVASTASGRVMRSSSAKSSRFGSSSSTIASITRSQSARSATSRRERQPRERRVALVRGQPLLLDGAAEVALDRRAPALARAPSSPRARPSRGRRSTLICAIPAPIVPSPTTPTFTRAILRKMRGAPPVLWT